MSDMKQSLAALLLTGWLSTTLALPAQAQAPVEIGQQEEDPFGQSQLMEPVVTGAPSVGGPQFVVRGFVDAGIINITQTGPLVDGGDLSWAFGNSQFTFWSQTSTFTVNEVDLTLEAQRETGTTLLGVRASIDYYPSRDVEAYTIPDSDREFSVDEAFVFLEFLQAWNTRIVLGRAPGFVTLEQQEIDSPDLRIIGHTYVFQAGGGYPYGLQVITRPSSSWAFKLGYSNGGVGDYGFFQGDDSTLNRPVARDADGASPVPEVDAMTIYGAVEWVPFDRPAEAGTLKLGLAGANNSGLTFNPTTQQPEPYQFSNFYLSYRYGGFEVRTESAKLEAFYELSLLQFEASMTYLLVSFFLGVNHVLTLRGEQITYTSGKTAGIEGEAVKSGLSYRYRFDENVILKLEGVREKQTPQFFNLDRGEELTTDVSATSWVYSF